MSSSLTVAHSDHTADRQDLQPHDVARADVFDIDSTTDGVVFDIDGTLATSSQDHLEAFSYATHEVFGARAEFEMHGERVHLNGRPIVGWVDSQCLRLIANDAGVEWLDVRDETLTAYAARYAFLLDQGASPGTLVPGAVAALTALRDHGIPMGLSTGNAAETARLKLAALGISEFFDFNPSAGFGWLHADRSAVALAAIAALPRTRSTYLVGDTMADMRAAVAAGAQGIGVVTGAENAHGLQSAGAGTVLADITDLPGLLSAPTGQPGGWFPKHVPGGVSAADLWMGYRPTDDSLTRS